VAVDRAAAAARSLALPGGHRFEVAAVPAGARAACLAALSPTSPALAGAPTLLACCLARPRPDPDPEAGAAGVELAAGGTLRTLVLGLHALGVGAAFEPAAPAARPALAAALRLDPAWRPLGLLGAGRRGQT
jgi:hypothetical protein